jgi:hypothetical protein
MVRVDQEMRFASIKDKKLWDDSIDHRNTARLKEIIKAIGWPTISKVGAEASNAAWLLVQHAYAEPDFMKECLELMRSCSEGDVALENLALLEDRLLTMDGNSQIYGSQFHRVNGGFEPFPIADLEHVDERRARMGMSTFSENADRLTREWDEAAAK